MRFSASTYYFASFVATLVLVTTLLPQPTSNIENSGKHPFFQLPKGCPGVGSSVTTARALDRLTPLDHLPCGVVWSGAATDTFSFSTSRTVKLLWRFEGGFVIQKLIRIMEINPTLNLYGKDRVVAAAPAYRFQLTGFNAVKGRKYYLVLSGQPPDLNMTWFFAR